MVMLATIRSRTFCLLVCCLKSIKITLYKAIILPECLYGCETLSPTLREEHELTEIENRVLRKTFILRRYVVTRGCRKLHNEERQDFYSSQVRSDGLGMQH
jgi:hypothetical protein